MAYEIFPEIRHLNLACWEIETFVVCCIEEANEQFLRDLVDARVHLDDSDGIAKAISVLRKLRPVVWPFEVGALLSREACMQRAMALEMILHVKNLGGHVPYANCANIEVGEKLSGAWRSVYESLSSCCITFERIGDKRAASKCKNLSNECISHAAGAAAEARFKSGKFSDARQLSAVARNLRPTCSFALTRLQAFDLVAQSHNEKRLDACETDSQLLGMLPPAAQLGRVIDE